MFATHLLYKPRISSLTEQAVAPSQPYSHIALPGEQSDFLVHMNLDYSDARYIPTVETNLPCNPKVYLGLFYYWTDDKDPATGRINTSPWLRRPSGFFYSGDMLIPDDEIGIDGAFRNTAIDRLSARSNGKTLVETGAYRYYCITLDLPEGVPAGNYHVNVSFQNQSCQVMVIVGTHTVDYPFPTGVAFNDAMSVHAQNGYGISSNSEFVDLTQTIDAELQKGGIANYYSKAWGYSINSKLEHAYMTNQSADETDPRCYWLDGQEMVDIPNVDLDYYKALAGYTELVAFAHMGGRFWSCDRNETTEEGCPRGWRFAQPGGPINFIDYLDMGDHDNPGFAFTRALRRRLEHENLWDQFDKWVVHFDEPPIEYESAHNGVYVPKPYAEQPAYVQRAAKLMKFYYDAGFAVGVDCPSATRFQMWIHDAFWTGSPVMGADGTPPISIFIVGAEDKLSTEYNDWETSERVFRLQRWSQDDQYLLDKYPDKEMGSYYVGRGSKMDIGGHSAGHVLPFLATWYWGGRFHLNYSIGRSNERFNHIEADSWLNQFHDKVGGNGGWNAIYCPYRPGETGPAITDTFITSLRIKTWMYGLNLVRRLEHWDREGGDAMGVMHSVLGLDETCLPLYTRPFPPTSEPVPLTDDDAKKVIALDLETWIGLQEEIPDPEPECPDCPECPECPEYSDEAVLAKLDEVCDTLAVLAEELRRIGEHFT